MARSRGGAEAPPEAAPEPVAAPAEPVAQAAEPESTATVKALEAAFPAPAPAAPRKKGGRSGELSIMKQIANRMKRLPSDAARTRVYGWYVEEFAPKEGA